MMQSTPPVALVSILLVLTAPAVRSAPEETRSLGAHVHGSASLDIAWEGNAVLIGLDSPAANLVGFEDAPETDAERAALVGAVAGLKDGARLFRFSPEAGCELAGAEVESALLAPAGSPDSDGHGDDEQAGQEEAEGHAEGHEHGVHADMEAEYRFECADPGKLRQVRVGLFEVFPATETLHVQLVGPEGQAAAELRAASPELRLR